MHVTFDAYYYYYYYFFIFTKAKHFKFEGSEGGIAPLSPPPGSGPSINMLADDVQVNSQKMTSVQDKILSSSLRL